MNDKARVALHQLKDETELQSLLDQLNEAGKEPALGGFDSSGPVFVYYLDGEGELDITLIRAQESLEYHEVDDTTCTPAWRLGDTGSPLLYWPLIVVFNEGEY